MPTGSAPIPELLAASAARDWDAVEASLAVLAELDRKQAEQSERFERYVAAYNAHDIDSLLAEFTPEASLLDEAWGEHIDGPRSLRAHFQAEFAAAPDIAMELRGRFSASPLSATPLSTGEPVALDLRITGTHEGPWRGLSATGRGFELISRGIAKLDRHSGLIRSIRYGYDRALLFQQLGLLHDPGSTRGRVATMLMHPVTMARVAGRRITTRPPAFPT